MNVRTRVFSACTHFYFLPYTQDVRNYRAAANKFNSGRVDEKHLNQAGMRHFIVMPVIVSRSCVCVCVCWKSLPASFYQC